MEIVCQKLCNLNEMDKFFEIHKLMKFTQKEIEYLLYCHQKAQNSY
jgi:hypothetical protein